MKAGCSVAVALLVVVGGCAAPQAKPSASAAKGHHAAATAPRKNRWTEAARRAAADALGADLLAHIDKLEQGHIELGVTVMPMTNAKHFESMVHRFEARIGTSKRLKVSDEGFNVVVYGEHFDLGRSACAAAAAAVAAAGKPAHHALVYRAVEIHSEELLWIGIHPSPAPASAARALPSSLTHLCAAGLQRIAADFGATLVKALAAHPSPLVIKLKDAIDVTGHEVPVALVSALVERQLYRRFGRKGPHILLAGGDGHLMARSARRRAALDPQRGKPADRLEANALLSGRLKPLGASKGFELQLSLVHTINQRTLWKRSATFTK
ncbi:MAG: hypothetical protein KC503_12705 [Myxococcales bacterium]|nr:hypothetical protein [Myxococcales bacterium]